MIIGRDIYVIEISTKNAAAELTRIRTGVNQLRDDLGGASTNLDRMERSLSSVEKSSAQTAERVRGFRTGLLEFDAALNLASRGVGVLRKGFDALSGSVNIANAFETELTAIDTITNQLGTRFRSQFLDISERTGQEAAEVARAAYEAVSAGVAQESAAQFVEVANELAKSGRAGLTESLELLATIREQFGLTIDQLGGVNSQIFLASRDGRVKVGELAQDLGSLIPLAKSAGQSLEEMLGGIVSITKAGITTNIATTQLRAYAVAVQKNGGKIAKALTEAGESLTETEFRSLSLAQQVQVLTKVFDGNEGALIKLFGRIEGVQAVQILARNGAVELENAVSASAAATNEASVAAAQFAATGAAAQQRLKATFQRQLIELGVQIMPTVNKVMGELVQLLRDNGERTAQFIEGIARGAVNLGRFVADFGEPILYFFGALLAQKLVNQAVAMASGLSALAQGVSGVGVAAKGAAPGVAALTGAVGGLLAVLPLLIAVAADFKREMADIAKTVDGIESASGNLIATIDGINRQNALGSFDSLDALQARRQAIRSGDQVVLDPSFTDNGAITRAAAEGVESMANLLERGFEQASDVVKANLKQLGDVAAQQAQERDVQLDALNAKLGELEAVDQAFAEAQLLNASGRALAERALQERRDTLTAELIVIEGQAADAQRRAAEAELTRANLSLKFQTEITRKLRGTFGAFTGSFPTLAELVAGGGGAAAASTGGGGGGGGGRGRRQPDELFIEGDDLEKARLEALQKFEAINRRAADNRVAAIEDGNERELAALDLRFSRELAAAERNGDDLDALRARQRRERLDLFDTLRTESAQRAQQRATIELQFIADAGARQVEALRQQHSAELREAEALGVDLVALREAQEQQITDIVQRQNEARTNSYFEAGEAIKDSTVAIFSILETLGLRSQVATGVQVVAEGLFLQAKAIRYGIEAVEKGLAFDPRAFGYAALALKAQAAAAKQYEIAAELGAGGGKSAARASVGAGGSGRNAPASGNQRPGVREQRSDEPTVIRLGDTYFTGTVFDTQTAVDQALARRTLSGLAALEGQTRGLPAVNWRRFGRTS